MCKSLILNKVKRYNMAEGCFQGPLFDSGDINIPCQPCSRKNKRSESVIYCADCDEVQCFNCSKDHETYVVMGHHVTVDIKDWRHSNDYLDLTKISQCEAHELTYEYFCEYDNRLCCRKCKDQAHQDCRNVKRISTMEHRLSGKEVESVDTKFEKLLNEAENISIRSGEHKSSVKRQVAELPSVVNDLRKSLLQMMDKFEETLQEHGKSIENKRIASLNQIQRRTSSVVSDIKNTLHNIKVIPKSMTPEQQFVYEKKMDEILERYDKKLKTQATKLRSIRDSVSVQFSEKLADFLKIPPIELGTLSTDSDQVDSDFLPEPKAVEFRYITATNMRSSTSVHPFFIGIDFLLNGRLVLADHVYKKCVVTNALLNVIGEQRLKYAPQNLLVFGNDQLLISSGNKNFIDYFEVNSENILTFKKRIETLAPCDSLSLIVDNTFAIGVAERTKPVCKLKNFKDIDDFEFNFDRKIFRLGDTKCSFCHRLEILVVTDFVKNTIRIINTRSGETTAVQDKVIRGPRGVVIGKDGSIFVCCEESCCLVQLSPSGDILSFRKLRMNFPHSICISKDCSKLAIANNSADDCLLQLFSIV